MLIDANSARTHLCRTAIAIVALSFLTACGGDSRGPVAPPPPVGFAGSYAMQSISDSALPHRVAHPQFTIFVVDSGHMVLNSDSSYTYDTEGKTYPGAVPATANDTGTFSASGSTISFDSKFLNGIIFTGVATDSSLAMALQGSLLGSIDITIPVYYKKLP